MAIGCRRALVAGALGAEIRVAVMLDDMCCRAVTRKPSARLSGTVCTGEAEKFLDDRRHVMLYLNEPMAIQSGMATMIQRDGLWDRAAMLLSGMCVVHCIATAVFVAAAASLGGLLGAEWVHELGLAIAIVLGGVGLGRGVLRHGYLFPVAIGSLGLGVMAGALSLPHGDMEVVYTIMGVSILALGHDLNFRATH